MNKKKLYLPYEALTATNKSIDFKFSLNKNTESPININVILNLLLNVLSKEIKILNPSNGDIIQALCMIIVIRSKMIDYNFEKIEKIVKETLDTAFKDGGNAIVKQSKHGNT